MAELLIYIIPTFAGVIGSRYLTRLANFIVMVLVFEFDIGILMGQLGPRALLSPYTVICIIPALAGIVCDRCFRKRSYDLQIGARYFLIGPIVTALIVVAVFWLCGVLWAYWSRGQFMPVSFLTTMSVSPGFVIPPLVFIVVAIVAHPLRRFATP